MSVAAGYCSYFALSAQPFSIAPDPAFLYPSLPHREALAHLRYGLEREGGFILLTGEVGTGKTTLARLLLQQLPENFDVAYVLSTQLDIAAMLDSICTELRVARVGDGTIKAQVDALNQSLMDRHARGKRILLVVEEAQALTIEVLEFLRLLTNLETDTHKLLHILLVGQPELLETIARQSLRQLNQRVVARYHLRPLRLEELEPYIAHRLQRCGAKQPLFDRASMRQLHKASGGIPRLINLIAERCLVGAFASRRHVVSRALVRAATREVLGVAGGAAPIQLLPSLLASAALAAVVVFFLFSHGSVPQSKADSAATSAAPSERAAVQVTVRPDRDYQPSAVESLLARWGVDERPADVRELCEVAPIHGLTCLERRRQSLQSLQYIGMPALVELASEADSRQYFLIDAIAEQTLWLVNSAQRLALRREEFEARWDGVALLLWRAPALQRPLAPGDSDRMFLEWVQRGLSGWQPQRGIVVNGGSYTADLVSEVEMFQREHGLEDDGVIGKETALVLSRYLPGVPRLGAVLPESR